jgi:hypothetical protein
MTSKIAQLSKNDSSARRVSKCTHALLLVGEGLLRAVDGACEFLIDFSVYRRAYGVGGQEYVTILKRQAELAELRRSIGVLKRRRLIETRRVGGRAAFRLTNAGQLLLLKQRMRFSKPLRGDTFCLISFDIPQQARMSRHALRNFLRGAGFRPVHQSAWVSDRDVFDDLLRAVELSGISRWATIYAATEARMRQSKFVQLSKS